MSVIVLVLREGAGRHQREAGRKDENGKTSSHRDLPDVCPDHSERGERSRARSVLPVQLASQTNDTGPPKPAGDPPSPTGDLNAPELLVLSADPWWGEPDNDPNVVNQ